MSIASARREARQAIRERLGFERMRPGQEEALAAVLDGRDTLAVLPTGSGKSAIYQAAAVQLPGPTVVVSPLIALQKDQAESISAMEIGGAALINSTVSERVREEAFEAAAEDEVEFLFLAPEQVANGDVLERVRAARPSLFVVDEAHCVSEWGHDFRPAYLALAGAIEAVGRPVVLALTATASPAVRDEIVERLGMRETKVVVRGFDRPNIWLGAEVFADDASRTRRLIEAVSQFDGSGIVYLATRRATEEAAELLRDSGIDAERYHAGLSGKERHAIQDRFMGGDTRVVCATSAFGMGIDKPDVRFVVHGNLPESVDAYYQAIGRAGRDGEPARALLLWRPEDEALQRFFASGKADEQLLRRLLTMLRRARKPLEFERISARFSASDGRLRSRLGLLEEAGGVARDGADSWLAAGEGTVEEVTANAVEARARRERFDETRVAMARSYAEARGCRREFLLGYFGEGLEAPCGNCDNCEAGVTRRNCEEEIVSFPVGVRVRHASFGEGAVTLCEGDRVTVRFDDAGFRTLSLERVEEDGLLEVVARDG